MAHLIVVCGLASEARIAAAPGVTVVTGGGDGRRLAADLEAFVRGARAMLSFGVAGGLAPGLKPGATLVAEAIVGPDGRGFATDPAWTQAIADRLAITPCLFAAVDQPLADVAGKAALHKATGAATVDMESHIVARAAAAQGVALAALRVVTDPADRALPHAASVGMRTDGSVDLFAILRSLAGNPAQLPGLVRTGLDARIAFAALLRCRQMLGPGFALLDL